MRSVEFMEVRPLGFGEMKPMDFLVDKSNETYFFQISLLLTMVMSLQAQNTILDSSVHRTTSGSSLQSMIFNNYPPKHEVRAVWLTTIGGIDWPHSYAQSAYSAEKQKQELVEILNRLQKAHINTVLIQTRVRGTMIYPSAYEPWDGCLSGFPGKVRVMMR